MDQFTLPEDGCFTIARHPYIICNTFEPLGDYFVKIGEPNEYRVSPEGKADLYFSVARKH
jgi:hypothetical protein